MTIEVDCKTCRFFGMGSYHCISCSKNRSDWQPKEELKPGDVIVVPKGTHIETPQPVNKALIYKVRNLGRSYCQTEGSAHYKEGGVEPIDLLISKGMIEDFCIGNMIKYATRFKVTRNLDDLKKVSDYAHILCGAELLKKEESQCSGS